MDVRMIGDRLRSQARFDMLKKLTKDPDKEDARSRAQSDCIAYQQQNSLAIDATLQAIQTALIKLLFRKA